MAGSSFFAGGAGGVSQATLDAAIAGLAAVYQPLDADLTAIAALATTAFGRSLLTQADAPTALTTIGGQPLDSDLTAIAALATTAFGRSWLTLADAAAALTLATAMPATAATPALTPTTGAVTLDLSANNGAVLLHGPLTGNVTYSTTNKAAGRSLTVIVTNGGTLRTFTVPAWATVGAAFPANIAANKVGVFTLTCQDGTDAAAVAAYSAVP